MHSFCIRYALVLPGILCLYKARCVRCATLLRHTLLLLTILINLGRTATIKTQALVHGCSSKRSAVSAFYRRTGQRAGFRTSPPLPRLSAGRSSCTIRYSYSCCPQQTQCPSPNLFSLPRPAHCYQIHLPCLYCVRYIQHAPPPPFTQKKDTNKLQYKCLLTQRH